MPNRIDRFSQLFFHAALFVACVFFIPKNAAAFTIPRDVTLQTDTFVQIMDQSEVESWYIQNKRFAFRPNEIREFESVSPNCITFSTFCDGFLSRLTREHIVLSSAPTIVPEKVRASIESFADKANRDPKNARLTAEDAKVAIAVPAEDGITVDIEKSLTALESKLQTTHADTLVVTLESSVTPAKVSAETLSSLGITELIGTATTNFRGSPKNRVYNINRSIQDFDGIVIDAGATFSFVDHLGEVDGEHGYLPELVIKNNQTTPEFGGGICQVSTTVFRAALQSGLKITERRNHAYPVQYYKPYGMDATIYVPKPDLHVRPASGPRA